MRFNFKTLSLFLAGLACAASVPAAIYSSTCGSNSSDLILNFIMTPVSVNCPGFIAPSNELIVSSTLRFFANFNSVDDDVNTVVMSFQAPVGSGFVNELTQVTATGQYVGQSVVTTTRTFSTGIANLAQFAVFASASASGLVDNAAFSILHRINTEIIGSTQQAPVQPSGGSGGSGWVFNGVNSGQWFDPPLTSGYDYLGLSGTTFTSIVLPTGLGPSFQVSFGPGLGASLGSFAAGASVNFNTLAGGPLGAFRISGIAPAVDSASPTAFPLQIFFSGATGSFSQTALSEVPEPSTCALVAIGLCFALRRRLPRA